VRIKEARADARFHPVVRIHVGRYKQPRHLFKYFPSTLTDLKTVALPQPLETLE
jgi:hypothetical protein